MAEESKKISFGFAKSIKKPILKNVILREEKKDYIKSVDKDGIKIIGEEKKKEVEPLVIPLRGSKTWHDRIINKVNADIYNKKSTRKIEEETLDAKKTEPSNDAGQTPLSLDEQAAKELIEGLSQGKNETESTNVLTVPVVREESTEGVKEPTLEDYQQIPIDGFGLAMLRGMNWQPEKGIGKNPKVVTLVDTESRSRWMGLGMNKATPRKESTNGQEEEWKLEKGAYVKITAGKYEGCYGRVENIDDDPGRLTVKPALGGDIISVNELMVEIVSKSEYSKNSKVLNVSKYEEYKNRDGKNRKSNESSESSDTEDRSKKKSSVDWRSSKVTTSDRRRSKGYEKYSSDGDNDAEKKGDRRKRSSPLYSNRKDRRKDKERERTREKSRERKSRDSGSGARRKHKRRS